MRRQNHSCDQCRKAKRACDAPSLRDGPRRSSVPESYGSESANSEKLASGEAVEQEYMPCSYCVKTNKHCTLNWARSQLQAAQAASTSRSNDRRSKRQRVEDRHGGPTFPSPPKSTTSTQQTASDPGDMAAPASGASVDMAFWAATQQTFPALPELDSYSHLSDNHHNFVNNTTLSTLGFGDHSATADSTGLMGLPFESLPVSTTELVSRPAFHNMSPDQMASWGILPVQSDIDASGAEAIIDMSPPGVFQSMPGEDEDISSTSAIADGLSVHKSPFLRHPYVPDRQTSYYSMMPSSPSSMEYILATRINNQSISQNLLQIYHDVLEHNLTCWITEETCPYNVWARPAKRKNIKNVAGADSTNGSTLATLGGRRSWSPMPHYNQQFGPQWSNRVYRRVTKLDKIAQAAGIMRLTRAQNQASQKALHLAIMAFATQWAQASQRQRETYGAGFGPTSSSMAEEFDRSIQRQLWQQARQALQDCADIESYRVVCAELIFGLTQRPWEEDEFVELEINSSTGYSTYPGNPEPESGQFSGQPSLQSAQAKRATILAKLGEILEKDGPPIFIERAARKIHAMKHKFDNYELGLLGEQLRQPFEAPDASTPSSEDGQTVGLLFWLAVMFDTISSSMTERPVVLADDESQHEAAEHDHMFSEGDPKSCATNGANPASTNKDSSGNQFLRKQKNNRWRIDLFIQDNPERSSPPQYRWPCSYDEAARTVTRSTPVKVLLYRYVLYLQNMLRKPYVTRGEPIEEILRETLLVYRYWNVTYSAFYRDLIEHHRTVPARIRGWFVCILAHWHLGALMLADAIELVDEHEAGLAEMRQMRAAAHTVACIRKSSAAQLADLARIATPRVSAGGSSSSNAADLAPQMPDFHFAVREGTVLTEPWTILLIRSFSRAAILHLRDIDELQQQPSADLLGHDEEALRNSLRRCEECVQALWYLGKKSDMARNVAGVLYRAMHA